MFFTFFLQKSLQNKKFAVYLHRQKEITRMTTQNGGFI